MTPWIICRALFEPCETCANVVTHACCQLCWPHMNSPDMQKRFIDTGALETLRRTTNWETVCEVLGLERDPKRSKGSDWWMRSPFSEDKTASFHIKPNDGIWYCFSTRQGGGVIEFRIFFAEKTA